MSATPLGILGAGMVTAVGLTAAESCAAIRADISNFSETGFTDVVGEPVIGAVVEPDLPLLGRERLLWMLTNAIRDCIDGAGDAPLEDIPVLLCTAEPDRPGVVDGDALRLFNEVQDELGVRFQEDSRIIAEGRMAAARALAEAGRLVYERNFPHVLIAGIDTYLTDETVHSFEKRFRLLTAANSDGFIPGEAGAAVLAGRPAANGAGGIACLGLGFGHEAAGVESEQPLRADGLVQAINAALADAGLGMADMDFRLTDVSGEQYMFKEAALAVLRTLRQRKEAFEIWHPADCIGEVGAAALPCMLGIARAAAENGYAPGDTVLCHLGNDDGGRAALVLRRQAEDG